MIKVFYEWYWKVWVEIMVEDQLCKLVINDFSKGKRDARSGMWIHYSPDSLKSMVGTITTSIYVCV